MKIKRGIVILLTLILLLSNAVPVCAAPADKKLPSGVSYREIGAEIESYVKEHEAATAGMEVAVFDRDDIIYQNQFGYINVEEKAVVQRDSVFGWGSITKLLVWVSVMQLWEAGNIDLEADIRTYLPDDFLSNIKYDAPVTMLNLMNHNAGFQEMVVDGYIEDFENVLPLGKQLQAHQPEQVFAPGTVTAYSNWGAALAGYIVEQISGQSFEAYVREHIFEKLGMEHTAIRPDLSDNVWVQKERLKLRCYEADGTPLETSFYHIPLYPMGMCAGTLGDLQKFAQAFLPKEGQSCPLFEHKDSLTEMLSASAEYGDTGIPRICHGFLTKEYAVHVMGHGGNSYGCSAQMLFDVESGTGVVVMTNQYLEEYYTEDMLALIFGKFEDSPLADINRHGIEKYMQNARTLYKGPLSLVSMLSENTGHGTLDAGEFWVMNETQDRKTVAVSSGVDYLILTPTEYILNKALLNIATIGICYAVATCILGGCIIHPIVWIRKRKRGNQQNTNWFDRWNYLTCGIVTLGMINLEIVTVMIYGNAFSGQYQWLLVANAILLVLLALSTAWSILRWKKLEGPKWKKIQYVLTVFFLVFIIVAAVRWQIYQFWAL